MNAFYIWNPHILYEQPPLLRFILTNGNTGYGIARNKGFIESITESLNIKAAVISWSITPYRSNYYSEYINEEDWRGIWQLIWMVEVVIDQKVILPIMRVPWIGTDAIGEDWWDGPEDNDRVKCLVVGDFDNEIMAEQAKTIIGNDLSVSDMREKYSTGSPVFYRTKVVNKYDQLQIDLGEFPAKFYIEGADYASHVISLCKQVGGTVHFEERSW